MGPSGEERGNLGGIKNRDNVSELDVHFTPESSAECVHSNVRFGQIADILKKKDRRKAVITFSLREMLSLAA